jgi:hypothetical protein
MNEEQERLQRKTQLIERILVGLQRTLQQPAAKENPDLTELIHKHYQELTLLFTDARGELQQEGLKEVTS